MPGEPAESNPEMGNAEDISSSVDEWFTQVSSLVRESGRDGIDSTEQQQQQSEPPRAEIEKPPAVPEEPFSEDFQEVAARSGEQAAQPTPETEEKPEPEEKPVAEEPDLFAEQEARPSAADEEVLTVAPAEIPAEAPVSGEKISPQEKEDAAELDSHRQGFAQTDEIIDLYFSQQCREVIEVFRHNLSRLSGPSSRRASRMLSRQLEQIVELSEDFGYESCNESLIKIRGFLDELASKGNGESVLLSRNLEELKTAVAELEREL